jgi:hypothetical protein
VSLSHYGRAATYEIPTSREAPSTYLPATAATTLDYSLSTMTNNAPLTELLAEIQAMTFVYIEDADVLNLIKTHRSFRDEAERCLFHRVNLPATSTLAVPLCDEDELVYVANKYDRWSSENQERNADYICKSSSRRNPVYLSLLSECIIGRSSVQSDGHW